MLPLPPLPSALRCALRATGCASVVVLDIVTAVAVSGSFLVQELVSTVQGASTGFIQVHILNASHRIHHIVLSSNQSDNADGGKDVVE